MTVYIDGVILLNSLVDFLLLLAAGRLCGRPTSVKKALLAAAFGGLYAATCMLPGFFFLGNLLWRTVSLAFLSLVAFGVSRAALRSGLVFAFLSFALGGAVMGMGKGGILGIVCAAGVLLVLCRVGFRSPIGSTQYVPVEIINGERRLQLTALQDTGNMLRDPITGRHVLVIGADVATELTGLSAEQLANPVATMGTLPGLRLIPYRSVGTGSSFLLAMRFSNVKIGNWKGSTLVAFAPDRLTGNGTYQALTGGVI